MSISKNKITEKQNLKNFVGDFTNFVTADILTKPFDLLKANPYFAIRNAVLYQYERKNARQSDDKFEIGKIKAI